MRPRYRRLLDKAEQDFQVAGILKLDAFSSIIAFHIQQGLEKLFKVCIGESGRRPPVTHDLVALWELIRQDVPLEINTTFLSLLNEFAVDIRYDKDATPEQAKLALEEAMKIRAVLIEWLEARP
jgi:HEPN domain-containing protein